jgi:predicted  nucleic acid-binding Zn-ribbon protein
MTPPVELFLGSGGFAIGGGTHQIQLHRKDMILRKEILRLSNRIDALEKKLNNLGDSLSHLAGDVTDIDSKHSALHSVTIESLDDAVSRIAHLAADQPRKDAHT